MSTDDKQPEQQPHEKLGVPVMPEPVADRPAWLNDQYKQLEEEFNAVIHGEHPWKPCKQTSEVCLKKMKSRHGNDILKAVFTVNCSAERLSRRVHGYSPYRPYWHHLLDHEKSELLECIDFDKGRIVVREHAKPMLMGLVSPRDCVVIAVHDLIPTGRRLMYKSIVHPDYPPSERAVRGFTQTAGFIMEHTDNPDVCRVTLVDDSDMQLTYLPQSVIDTVAPTCTMMVIKNLQKAAKIKDMPHQPLPGTP